MKEVKCHRCKAIRECKTLVFKRRNPIRLCNKCSEFLKNGFSDSVSIAGQHYFRKKTGQFIKITNEKEVEVLEYMDRNALSADELNDCKAILMMLRAK